MADTKKPKPTQPPPARSEDARARSAAALRENLRRRKAKVRGQSAPASPSDSCDGEKTQ